jgi:hypothetical protein
MNIRGLEDLKEVLQIVRVGNDGVGRTNFDHDGSGDAGVDPD